MALYKDTNLTLYEVKHCVSGTCKANTRQWIHKLKLTCACDHSNITSHIFRHPCHHSRRPRVVRDWNHPIYMGLWPGAHFWGQGGGGIFLKVSQAKKNPWFQPSFVERFYNGIHIWTRLIVLTVQRSSLNKPDVEVVRVTSEGNFPACKKLHQYRYYPI